MVQEINFPIYPYSNEPGQKPRNTNYTLSQLLTAAHRHIDSKTATYVHIKKLERLLDTKGRMAIRATSTTVDPANTPPKRTHYCSIRVKDPAYKGKIYNAPGVLCDCSCAQWVYRYEYALWYRGAAQMLRCNGEYPTETNPSLYISLCKHLVALGLECLRRKI